MRTNIVIDDKLMKAALRATGLKTKREVVELGLRMLLELRGQEEIRKYRGKLMWEGDLDSVRTDRDPG
jgi:Arc/MetJ family transcription regulator